MDKNHSEIIPSNEDQIENIKDWFYEKVGNSNARGVNYDSKTILWEKGKKLKFNFGDAWIIPIKYEKPLFILYSNKKIDKNKKPDKNISKIENSTLDYLLIKINTKGQYSESLISRIPENDYLLKSNGMKKSLLFDGLYVIKNWNGKVLDYYKYTNGKVVGKKPANNGKAQTTYCVDQDFFYQGSYMGEDGNMVYGDIHYSHTTTTCYQVNLPGGGQDQFPGPEYGGGAGESGGPGGIGGGGETQNLVDEFTDDCYTNVLNQLKNNSFLATVTDVLLQLNFNTNLSIKFQNSKFYEPDPDVSGTYSYGNPFNGTVTLYDDVLVGASKEYIAATIYHEVIHGFLRHGDKHYFDHHEQMGLIYVNNIAAKLLASFPNLTQLDAMALAWGGIEGSSSWKSLPNNVQNNYININKEYKNKDGNRTNSTKGTHCE